ncbi:MAG: hypothetical protein H7Z20_08410 [Bdellovibrio sp.]|nr:hypothetical protein [Methylotenera sp.]
MLQVINRSLAYCSTIIDEGVNEYTQTINPSWAHFWHSCCCMPYCWLCSYNAWWQVGVSHDVMNNILVLGAFLIGFVIFLIANVVVTIEQIKHKAPQRVILIAWAPIGFAIAGL